MMLLIFILQGTYLGDGNIHSVGHYGQNCNWSDDPSGQIWVNSPLATKRARRHKKKSRAVARWRKAACRRGESNKQTANEKSIHSTKGSIKWQMIWVDIGHSFQWMILLNTLVLTLHLLSKEQYILQGTNENSTGYLERNLQNMKENIKASIQNIPILPHMPCQDLSHHQVICTILAFFLSFSLRVPLALLTSFIIF